MQIIIGSKNDVKISAVKEVLSDYEIFCNAEWIALAAPSEVGEQPMTMEETLLGAKNRAEYAYRHCSSGSTYGVGLESGLMPIPASDEYMDVCFCSIYDGDRHHLGMSCGFPLPRQVSRLIVEEGLDLNQAMYRSGLTDQTALGAGEGAIGLLSNGRITRKSYTKQCLITAMISLEQTINSDLPMQTL